MARHRFGIARSRLRWKSIRAAPNQSDAGPSHSKLSIFVEVGMFGNQQAHFDGEISGARRSAPLHGPTKWQTSAAVRTRPRYGKWKATC